VVVLRRAQFVLGLAALVGAALASSSAGQGPAPSVRRPDAASPIFTKAIAAQRSRARGWRNASGIVGSGVGLTPAGQPVIEVFTTRPRVAVPKTIGGVRVEPVETGMIVARSATLRYPRPVPIGVSSGLADFGTGTLGARVSNGSTVYALSNNHVFAGINTLLGGSIGDPILQPGPVEDGGTDPDDRIGTLADYQEIDFNPGSANTMDAAIALTTTADVGTATLPDGYGAPSSTTTPASIGLPVQKYGRTTGFTQGTINAVNVDLDVCYFPLTETECFPGFEAHFVNQFAIPDASVPFSASGDSGSLVVAQGGNQPVGLLFAGGDGLTIANPIGPVLQRFNVTIDGTPSGPGPPGPPAGLSATPGDASVSLSWSAPSFDGGSQLTGYKLYRGTSPNPANVVATLPATPTSYVDSGRQNGTTYYYKVSALNANGEGSLSNQASATPNPLVLPSEPLPTLDNFDRPNENPLSDSGNWAPTGIAGSAETGLYIPSSWLACSKSTTCTAYRNTQYGPDVEVWARLSVLPGDNNQLRLLARVQQPGTAGYDGYMLRPNQLPGTDQVLFERVDDGNFVPLLTVNQDLVAGDLFLLRVKGSIMEAWRQRGTTWTRLGVVTDSTYSGAGYVGVGMRGTTGRADDFGARTLGGAGPTPPTVPLNLQATGGNGQVSLTWSAPASDGGSQVTGYKIYRSTSAGTETLLASPPGTGTSYVDSGLQNGTTYYYKVSAVNAVNEGPLSTEASATPTDLVPPVEPLAILDTFNRADENPLSFGGGWENGILGKSERSLKVVSNQCASDRTTMATAWWTTPLGVDSEAYATIATLPGNGNGVRLYARLQTPGSSAVDGYVLLYNQLSGTDQVVLYRMTNGVLTQLASVNREVAIGNTLLLRAKGTALEAWIKSGSTWTRLSQVSDSTFTGAGFAGLGIRGKTGRVDDFGAR
jgi:Fibronectin type III domain